MTALPSDWKSLRLDEICSFHRGLTYKKTDEIDFSTNAVLRANNVSLESGELDLSEIRYINDQIKIPAAKKVRKGSLLVCMASGSKKHLGKVALIDEDYGYAFGGFMGLLLPNAIVYPKYLYWITQSKDYSDYIMGLSHGANINNLKFSQLGQYQVPLPPIPEQTRIVAILDEAFAGIATAVANTEKNLANARELFDRTAQAIFLATQDWEERSLSELLEMGWITSHLDGNHGSEYPRKSEFVDQGVPYISANCLKHDSVDFEAAKFLTKERASSIRKGIAQDGDVLFAHNATVGPVAVLRTDFEKVILSTSLTYYRCNSDYISPGYLAHYMRSLLFRRQYESVMRQSTRNQVPITMQRRFIHLIPPIKRQREIAEQLDSLRMETRRLESNYRQKLIALTELKQSLLQRAFCGELATASQDEIETALA